MATDRIPVQFATQYYPSRYAATGTLQLVNMLAQPAPAGAKTPLIIERSDGIEPWADLKTRMATLGVFPGNSWKTSGGETMSGYAYDVRGAKAMGAKFYVIIESELYSVDSSGALNAGTSLNPALPIDGEGRVSMATDGDNLVIITSAGTGYCWKESTAAFVEITDADFPLASWVVWMDQYFIVGVKDTGRFQISALADPLTWDALDIATAESNPDNLIAGMRDHRDLLLFGSESIEIWYNSGAADFPFERAPDGLIEAGLAAAHSVGRIDNTPFFLAREEGGLSIRRMQGRAPTRISTPGMDDEFDAYSRFDDAFALTWAHAGRSFYAITFPSEFVTWVYDCSTQLWHRRKSWNSNQWRVVAMDDAFDSVICVDVLELGLGIFNRDWHQEWGDPIAWQAVTTPVANAGRLLTFNRVELEVDAGRGLVETTPPTPGQNPSLWLSWSDDDGRTWSSEHRRSMGKRGKYKTRLIWHNCGSTRRGRVFRVRGGEPVPSALISMFVDVTAGV